MDRTVMTSITRNIFLHLFLVQLLCAKCWVEYTCAFMYKCYMFTLLDGHYCLPTVDIRVFGVGLGGVMVGMGAQVGIIPLHPQFLLPVVFSSRTSKKQF